MKFNIGLLAPIVGTLGVAGIWIAVAHETNPLWTLLVCLFLQLIGFLLVLMPDPKDTQTEKDKSNPLAWLPYILCIVGIFFMALYKSHA